MGREKVDPFFIELDRGFPYQGFKFFCASLNLLVWFLG